MSPEQLGSLTRRYDQNLDPLCMQDRQHREVGNDQRISIANLLAGLVNYRNMQARFEGHRPSTLRCVCFGGSMGLETSVINPEIQEDIA